MSKIRKATTAIPVSTPDNAGGIWRMDNRKKKYRRPEAETECISERVNI
ncbi:hypothetical protein ACFQY3_04185 [Paenibacillus farraposensis]